MIIAILTHYLFLATIKHCLTRVDGTLTRPHSSSLKLGTAQDEQVVTGLALYEVA